MSITIEEMQKQVHLLAREKGWWPLFNWGQNRIEEMQKDIANPEYDKDKKINFSEVNISEKLMLISDELSEAHEHYRGPDGITTWFIDDAQRKALYNGDHSFAQEGRKPDGFWIELADAIIRILDLAGAYDIDMEDLIKLKHAYNKTRPYRHGNKKC